MAGTRKSNTDISQTEILKKFSLFLSSKPYASSALEKLKSGHCLGFTVFSLYAKWLELSQPPRINHGEPIPRDDWPWLENLLLQIATWDGKRSKKHRKRKFFKNIDRLLQIILFFQKSNTCLNVSNLDIQRFLNDTNSERTFIAEYKIAGIFSCDDFSKTIDINNKKTTIFDEIIKEDRMVFLFIYDHAIGLIRHENNIYYYNSNNDNGWRTLPENDIAAIIQEIFINNDLIVSSAYSFSILCLSANTQKKVFYASQAELLKYASKQLVSADNSKTTALMVAAEIGCLDSMRYHFNHPPIDIKHYVLLKDEGNQTAFGTTYCFAECANFLLTAIPNFEYPQNELNDFFKNAVIHGQCESVKLLLDRDFDIDFMYEGETALHMAAKHFDIEMLELFLAEGADPDIKDKNNATPLLICATIGNLAGAKRLIQCNAKTDCHDHAVTPIIQAIAFNHYSVVDFLVHSPLVALTFEDYQQLVALYDESPKKKFLDWVHVAEFNLFFQLLRGQLLIVRDTFPAYYHHAVKDVYSQTLEYIRAADISPRCKTLCMIHHLFPVFEAGITHTATAAVAGTFKELKKPLQALIDIFGIKPVDIRNYQFIISSSKLRHII